MNIGILVVATDADNTPVIDWRTVHVPICTKEMADLYVTNWRKHNPNLLLKRMLLQPVKGRVSTV